MWKRGLLVAGSAAALACFYASTPRALDAARQAWPPFALVAGLLVIGFLAHRDGAFAWAGARMARLPGGNRTAFVAAMGLVAVVTAVLNLDSSVVFLTPVLIHLARARGTDELPFLYGAVFMSNSASLLLPGSNLTNLLVLSHQRASGTTFASRMLPAWIAAIIVTTVVLLFFVKRDPVRGATTGSPPPLSVREGVVGTVVAAALIIMLPEPALPVCALAACLLVVRGARHALAGVDVLRHLDLPVLAGLFGVVIAFGTLARAWSGPAHLVAIAGRWQTATLGAFSAITINNLPAAVLLSARRPAHPLSLLIGLNVGPNLAVTGSLSAILWFRAARSVGAEPSAARYSKLGIFVGVLTMAAALLALSIFSRGT